MSENKPENAGTPGTPSPSGTPAEVSKPDIATSEVSQPETAPASPKAGLPPSHEDAIQSPLKDLPPDSSPSTPPQAAAPTPAAEEAAARSSTDDPISASAVTPTDPASAQQRDAAEARASAAASTARQEAAVHQQRDAAQAKSGATQAASASGSASASATPGATDATAAKPAAASASTAAPDARGAAGSPPPGFGAAPDFSASNPPPPNALPPSPPRYLKQTDSAWSVFGRVIAARARRIFDRAGQRITQRTLRIGVSARIFHPEPGAKGLRGKTLQYLEESIAHWVMSRDVLVFMIPTVGHEGMLHPSNIRLRDYAKHLDGLLLQGGADVSPQSYAEQATSPEWPGDRVRDMYELELLHEFIESGKPVLGVCRGCQLINVAFGGTLYQDIATDVPTAGVHVNEHYDQHRHGIHFPDGSTLANMFPGRRDAIVNSIHHQAVKTLGRDLNIEAVSASDGIIEAVRYRRAPFVMGVQWHPEFHRAGGPELLDCTPLLDTFLRVARETRF
ncbi:gamma-glutamyl-gamma-aminobutyrate hydrolase family protein [Paraburkholderia phenazinium]|jgi:putative glutamine amidotransferase|uniref:Gamma-glutamyl-gamma-aminobutyrate hydrolase PuuD (Putrescine degradation), contains GATase1-like domain n=1 Tax=Paraburkholderia phenazinium TaxID=60549 RepID=A0A1G7W050_9BURK|nr:type 1 glutamine amidotransferase [Paraburkholderia phenazinium]SDG65238.1 Gamma-glutamyl-gamma-aminobutyrate hydrolase PuuD (putrescine degradation), contains GATase1-like domain [Paraburkholderia phenazinium]